MPDPSKIYVIVNPHAAHGLAGKRWSRILDFLNTQGIEVSAHLTRGRSHACRLAQDALENGAQLIISVGGEGTLNEIVNGMLHGAPLFQNLPELVMIPIGTGCDLSRTLNIPKDYEEAIDIILNGRTKLVDIAKVVFKNDTRIWERYFVNAFDVGLGGNVVRIANIIPKNLGGFLTFLVSSLLALITFRRMKMIVYLDGRCIDSGLITIIGALNGQFFGGGMHAAPMACIDDGMLELLYVKDTNIFKFVTKVLARVYGGEHLAYHNVYHYQGKKIKIESSRVFLADVDGEEEKAKEVTVTIIPRALKVKVPWGQA